MHASSEWKLSAQRIRESLRPLRSAVSFEAIRAWALRVHAKPSVARVVHLYAHLEPAARQKTAGAVALASLAMALGVGVHFDGVFDLHAPTLEGRSSACFELGLVWALTACALWTAALIARQPGDTSPRPTLSEMAIAVGIARIPIVLLSAVIALFAAAPPGSAGAIMRIVIGTPLVLVFCMLLYTGFVSATSLGARAALLPFLGAMVTAEAIAKALLGMP
jgi:hypothetical protein